MTEDENNQVRLIRHSRGQKQPELQPIVLEYKKRKKKAKDAAEETKAKYSKGLEDIQSLEGDVVRVAQRATKALSKGVDTYEHERQQSSKEKTDGAIEDFFHNSAAAASAFMKEASEIPVDVAESLNKKSYRKRLRRGLRRASKIIRTWRI
jgi:hypothetical protein